MGHRKRGVGLPALARASGITVFVQAFYSGCGRSARLPVAGIAGIDLRARIEVRHRIAAAAVALLTLPLVFADSILVAVVLGFCRRASVGAAVRLLVPRRPGRPRACHDRGVHVERRGARRRAAIGDSLAGVLVSSVGVWACFAQTAVTVGAIIIWDLAWMR